MKKILTDSFTKMSSDFKRQPGSFVGENSPGQSSLFDNNEDSKESIIKKWKKMKKLPTKKVYQLGIDTPIIEKKPTGSL